MTFFKKQQPATKVKLLVQVVVYVITTKKLKEDIPKQILTSTKLLELNLLHR